MQRHFGKCIIELIDGDITQHEVDAIVNAANSRLQGGGGVDGAIHAAGGPEILLECTRRYPNGCPTGSAVITGAGKLRSRYVIHAVGPIYTDGQRGEAELLAKAYRKSLELAVDHDCDSIAFPAISCGAYKFPHDQAAAIALQTSFDFVQERQRPRDVRFVLSGYTMFCLFARILQKYPSQEQMAS